MISVADHVLSEKLNNIYFIWGRGKTTVAETLRARYGFYVYSTDDACPRLMKKAAPSQQPYMCRDCLHKYGVTNIRALPSEKYSDWEHHVVAEMTPMILSELVILGAQHQVVLCEGDIDYAAVMELDVHAVHLHQCGSHSGRGDGDTIPEWVHDFGIKSLGWTRGTSPMQMADAVARYFGFAQ